MAAPAVGRSFLRLQDGANLNFRYWQVDTVKTPTAAGTTLTLTLTTGSGGATPPAVETSLLCDVYADNGTGPVYLNSVTFTAGGGSPQTRSMYLTDTPASAGGAARSGTYIIVVHAIQGSGLGASQYNVDGFGGGTPPTGFTIGAFSVGYVQSSTTATLGLSKVSGGAKPSPFAYPDAVWGRLILTAPPIVGSPAVQLSLTTGGAAATANATMVAGTGAYDVLISAVDNRFGAAAVVHTLSIGTISNASAAGVGPWLVLTNTPTDTATVDPRITRTPLFQLDSNTFATPPKSTDSAPHIRQATQQGFLADRFTNARGEGLNGITYNVALTPVLPGSPVTATGLVTTTQGGQTGWAPSFLGWDKGLPGGRWDKTATITAPAGATGASYLVLAAGENDIYSLIAKNPNLDVRMNVQHLSGQGGRHFSAGMNLIPTCYMLDASTGVRVPTADISSAVLSVVRAATAANPDGSGTKWEYLDASGAWVTWAPADPVYRFPMTPSAADSTTFERVFTTDASWGTRDIRFNIMLTYNNVLYFTTYIVINVDDKNRHDGYAFDGPGFLGFPTR